jgi:hypothetical protein
VNRVFPSASFLWQTCLCPDRLDEALEQGEKTTPQQNATQAQPAPETETVVPFQVKAALLYHHARQWAMRLPVKARVVLGLFLAAALLMAMYTAFTAKDASLHLRLQHAFHNAQVSVWVDGDFVYSGKVSGSIRKKFGLIPTASAQGSLSQLIPVRSGQHRCPRAHRAR